MHVYCTFFLALLLLSTASLAQEKPEAPKPKTGHKVFIAGMSLLAASKTADAITTRQNLDRGYVELNPIFGRRPSPATQAGINAAFFAGQVIAFHFTEKSSHPFIRWAGRVLIGYQIADHARAAACNAGLNVHSSQGCSPI